MKRFNYVSSNTAMTIRELIEKMKSGTFTSDISFQRGDAWDVDRRSFLIDTVLKNGIIPPITLSKSEDGIYRILDGKQRTTTIFKFVNNEFELQNLDEDMEDFEGLMFDELDEQYQNWIMDKTIKLDIYDGLSTEEEKELFFRLNNGKPLTNFEQVKAKCKSLEIAKDFIAENETFKEDKLGKTEDKRLELFFKAWTIMFHEHPSFEKKQLNPIMIETRVSKEQIKEMNEVFDYIYDGIKYLDDLDSEQKANEKARKRILTATHFLSLLPIAKMAIEDKVEDKNFILWAKGFYSGGRRASIDDVYNDYATRGSAKADSIAKRNTRLMDSYTKKFAE